MGGQDSGGRLGIRTPGASQHNGFQDREKALKTGIFLKLTTF